LGSRYGLVAGRPRVKDLLGKLGARLVGAALVNVAADAELRKYLTAA